MREFDFNILMKEIDSKISSDRRFVGNVDSIEDLEYFLNNSVDDYTDMTLRWAYVKVLILKKKSGSIDPEDNEVFSREMCISWVECFDSFVELEKVESSLMDIFE